MGFAMALGQYFSTKVDKTVKISDYSCICTGYVFTIVAVVLMLIVYYLPVKAVVFVA